MDNFFWKWFLPILISYLLGSMLPGYILPLYIKKVDIRKIGDGNPGTINVKRTLGYPLAIFVGIYDIGKGLLSMYIAHQIFNAPIECVVLSGFASIIGHKYPFYLRFRGGRGIASTIGIFIYMLVKVVKDFFTPREILTLVSFILVYALLMRLSTHDEDFFTVTIFPIFGLILAVKVKSVSELLLVIFLMGMIFYESSKNLKLKMFTLKNEKYTLWRIFFKPLSLIFIILVDFVDRRTLVYIIGSILFVFFVLDIVRLVLPRFEKALDREIFRNVRILRAGEHGRISSFTNFMLGVFLIYTLLPLNIANVSLAFLSVGDMFSKIVEMNFGETKIFRSKIKSIEGSLAFMGASISIAYIAWISGGLPLWIGTLGAVVATLIESIPSQIDDNITVPIVSGAFMEIITKLFL